MNRGWVLLFLAVGCAGVQEDTCLRSELIDAYVDADGDGFGAGEATAVCALGEGEVDNRLDCNDADPLIYPGAEEACNAVDDNCNGELDEGHPTETYFLDIDGDGFGSLFPAVNTCGGPPEGFVANSDDCNDDNAEINPAADEICNDGLDDNCDGLADDSDSGTIESSMNTFYEDNDADGFGALTRPVQQCALRGGLVDNFVDCDDRFAEITNSPFPQDADLDGYGDELGTVMSCEGYPGTADNRDDCDDSDPWVNIPKEWYTDLDGDGFGAAPAESFGCFPPNGVAVGPFLGECDDANPDINGGVVEDCFDGIDQNCNGKVDCLDNDCVAVEDCLLDCVDFGVPAEVPVTFETTTIGMGDDFRLSCGYPFYSQDDVTLQWRAPATGTYEFNTFGSAQTYTAMGIFSGDSGDCDGSELGCNLFSYSGGRGSDDYYHSRVRNISVEEGELIIIKVDGYFRYAAGDITLNIIED